jgi:tRNA A-37 threonylcarbamoyl transferase component Bud32
MNTNIFNTIFIENGNIIKVGPNETIKKELYGLLELSKYINVPKVISFSEDKIIMEYINGETISSIFLKGQLNKILFEKILIIIDNLHNIKNDETNDFLINFKIKKWIIDKFNYRMELLDYKKNHCVELYHKLDNWLNMYQVNTVGYTHGDLWFPNIIYSSNENIVFIDPRGCSYKNNTIINDINYDYAKLLQSLLGYDSLLYEINEPYNKNDLLSFFKKYLLNKSIDYNTILYYSCMLMLGSNLFIKENKKIEVIELINKILNFNNK